MQIGTEKFIYLFAALMTVAAYWVNANSLTTVSIAIVGFGMLLSLLDITKGCQYFFIMVLAFSDFTFESVYGANAEQVSLGGIYMAKVGGATLIVFWSVFNLFLVFLKKGEVVLRNLKKLSIIKIMLIMFMLSIVSMSINLFLNGTLNVRIVVSDIGIYVNVILGFFTIILIVKDDHTLKKYFNLFVIIILTQLLIVIISSYILSRKVSIINFYAGTETYFIGAIFLVFLLLLRSRMELKHSVKVSKILLFIAMLTVVLFIFVVPSRGRMLALTFPILIYLIVGRRWGLFIGIPIFIFLGIYLVQIINPKFYDYFLWKINTFSPTTTASDSSLIRLIEMVNIFGEQLTMPLYFFMGKGLGGFFTSNTMGFSGVSLIDSFPAEWIKQNKFYKPHGTWLYLYLKSGFVMTSIFYFYVFKLFRRGVKALKGKDISYNKIIVSGLFLFLPMCSIIMFSSKLQIMFGMAVGFGTLALKYMKKSKNTVLEKTN